MNFAVGIINGMCKLQHPGMYI